MPLARHHQARKPRLAVRVAKEEEETAEDRAAVEMAQAAVAVRTVAAPAWMKARRDTPDGLVGVGHRDLSTCSIWKPISITVAVARTQAEVNPIFADKIARVNDYPRLRHGHAP